MLQTHSMSEKEHYRGGGRKPLKCGCSDYHVNLNFSDKTLSLLKEGAKKWVCSCTPFPPPLHYVTILPCDLQKFKIHTLYKSVAVHTQESWNNTPNCCIYIGTWNRCRSSFIFHKFILVGDNKATRAITYIFIALHIFLGKVRNKIYPDRGR